MRRTVIKIAITNLFMYLFISYIYWDLTWFKLIPYMKEEDRFFSFLLYLLFSSFIYLMSETFSFKSK